MDFIPFISFLTGIVSIFSPCIIPVLPILFGFTIKNKKSNEILLFVLGLFSIFTVLIFVTGFFTVIFYSYIRYVRILSAIVLFVIGILFISGKTFNISLKNNSDAGSFLMGVITSLAWSPCYGGYVISLMTLLLTSGDPIYNGFNIILYSLGFAFALFILSFIISKINVEKLIKNTGYIRKISGLLFVISAIYMFLISLGF